MKEQLLELVYKNADKFDSREFECLIVLIDDGTITNFEQLAEYGVCK